ncbi:MAG: hypothetical protein GY865_02555, partial [candidate division Zixibacteria bacterium]|nr:hypothetical protein [candidate division Zixibacteria bacterium]
MAIGRDDQNDVSRPQLVSDGSDGFYLGWRDDATGWIYASHVYGDLTRETAFRISNPALGYAGLFDMALYPGGKLAVAWEQFFTGSSIIFRIFSSDGTPLTENITINDETTATYRAPVVAVEPSGNSAVTWEDSRNGNADIYMQFVNSDGSLYGTNQRIIDFDYLTDEQFLPEIVFSAIGGYIISWLDDRSGTQRLFLQRITRTDGLIGDNQNISANIEGTEDWFISMAIDLSGNLAVAWSSIGNGDKVLIQKFLSNVTPDGSIITANDINSKTGWETSLEFDNNNNLYCIWSDSRRGNWDIYLRQFGSDSSPLSTDDILVNDDSIGAHSTQPAIDAYDQESAYVAVFSDKRNDDGDIFLQLIGDNGISDLINNPINIDNQMVLQTEPDISIIDVDALIVWKDNRAINGVMGQRILGSHLVQNIPSEGNLIISDTNSITPKANPSVATFVDGSAMVSWIDYANGDGQIYSRKIGYQINDWSEVFEVSDKLTEFNNIDINVMSDNNIFIIAWLSQGIDGGPSAIFARYDSEVTFINKFGFNSDETGQSISNIAAASNANGDIYLLWVGKGAVDYLYLTVFDKTGSVIHPTYEITGGIGGIKEEIDIAVDGHGSVIATWVDDRNSRDEVFYQVFYPDLTPFGSNKSVSDTQQRYMKSPTVAMDGQKAVIAWVDSRANGNNVYMTQIDYSATDIDDFEPNTLPS